MLASVAASSKVVDDPTAGRAYVATSGGVETPAVAPQGMPLVVWPNTLQRIYFGWSLANLSAPITQTLSVKVWHRPREVQLLMADFSAAFRTRADTPVVLPAGLQLDVLRFGASVQGGYDSAEVEATGPELALHKLRGWLRYRVEIHGPGGACWAGRVEEISLRLGNVTASISGENLFNAINVIYSYTGDDGGSDTATTGWLVDDESANEFGRRRLAQRGR